MGLSYILLFLVLCAYFKKFDAISSNLIIFVWCVSLMCACMCVCVLWKLGSVCRLVFNPCLRLGVYLNCGFLRFMKNVFF